jgi:predicted transcriptional regulator
MPPAIVLAITAENAQALLSGERDRDHRRIPPRKLPARAYLAVVGTGSVVGECILGAAERKTTRGWALPVIKPRRYRRPRPVADFGLARIPRSFRYVGEAVSGTPARSGRSR